MTMSLTIRFRLILAQKPHRSAIRVIAVLEEDGLVASMAEADNRIFFFVFHNEALRPVRCLPLEKEAVAFCWRKKHKTRHKQLVRRRKNF